MWLPINIIEFTRAGSYKFYSTDKLVWHHSVEDSEGHSK